MRIAVATAAAAFSAAFFARENSCASAFSTVAAGAAPRWTSRRRMFHSAHAACTTSSMSASASGTPATWPVSSPALGLQEKLRRLCANKSGPNRETKIEQLATELNALNPTKEPAYSPLLAGRWKMIYSTVPGPSSGRLGPFQADVFQDIRPEEKRIFNILELGPSWALRGALEADVEVLDGQNWAINFDVVYNAFAGVRVQEKKFDQDVQRRIWSMTYLDPGFRILYGRQEGTPAEEAFIFVLERDLRSSQETTSG